ncbi:hypothetical protein K7472_08080 [Streptomyces sp. PTM05]|uniref:Uncharacterized protein n=1 Tax=Streptantibioticus parmotrematis TaxID=2873249 RepID=A0ABS7QNQ5_9ACTN|nr:hypothetical protein [Streptantibioticus parmotrematis]MBY8884803.1 hypothetical protein [Streptantibioticus parmotrematis]
MRITNTPSGDVVAVMEGKELVLTESALMHYLAGPGVDSNLAARMMTAVSAANEDRQRREEAEAADREADSGTVA